MLENFSILQQTSYYYRYDYYCCCCNYCYNAKFADCVDSWKPVADYVEKQFEQFFQDETGLNRHNIKDTRVHCCLYFIPPYGRG